LERTSPLNSPPHSSWPVVRFITAIATHTVMWTCMSPESLQLTKPLLPTDGGSGNTSFYKSWQWHMQWLHQQIFPRTKTITQHTPMSCLWSVTNVHGTPGWYVYCHGGGTCMPKWTWHPCQQ
jgi:hypothetical protein